jgi:hypothetical protein
MAARWSSIRWAILTIRISRHASFPNWEPAAVVEVVEAVLRERAARERDQVAWEQAAFLDPPDSRVPVASQVRSAASAERRVQPARA